MLFKSILIVIAVFSFTRVLARDTHYFQLPNPWNGVKDPNGFYTRECISDNGYCPEEKDSVPDVPKNPEVAAEFPGGKAAWERFLHRNLRYPQDAQDNDIQGFVVVQFVVDREGNVSQVQAISGPAELRGEAERVIKKSGKWEPAVQNARKVPSYKKQPIGFSLQDQ